jgi:hypothetical protein
MQLQCPQCERTGEIPDRFGLTPHRVRCRTCGMRFWTAPLPDKAQIDHFASPMEEPPDSRVARDRAPLAATPILAGHDDDEGPTFGALGPEDSHYELTVSNDDENDDDSQVELPALTSDDAPSSDEIDVFTEDPPSAEILIGDPRHPYVADLQARYRFVATVSAGALSLAIVGFMTRRGILSAQTVSSSIAMTKKPLHLLPGELAKDLRRPRSRSNLDSQIASE